MRDAGIYSFKAYDRPSISTLHKVRYPGIDLEGGVGGGGVALYIIDALSLVGAMIASEKSIFIAFCVSILLKEGGRQLLTVPEQAAGLLLADPSDGVL